MILKLGTRRSALALAQSTHIKHALEKVHPGLNIDLVGIDTKADETQQTRFSTEPLQNLDGKNFFVKELDDALLAKHTDFSVHSYKDLSLDRPEGLTIAAIPPRANPRDIVLFHPDILEKLKRGETITIGSSSPRRAENTPEFLKSVLPYARQGGRASHEPAKQGPIAEQGGEAGGIKILTRSLRGNVNTRIKKLEAGEYDAIILAFAGLIRLEADIKKFPKIILPLDVCPAAPAQGALAIECRSDDGETKKLLSTIHHPPTAAQIATEREVLKRFGGGCHQAFGATVAEFGVRSSEFSDVLFVKGRSDTGELLDITEFKQPNYSGGIIAWDGSKYRAEKTQTLPSTIHHPLSTAVFIAHHRAATPEILPQLKGKRIWTSGVASMQKLAEQGLWVEGCGENLGFETLRGMLAEPVLGLPPFKEWMVLTHKDAVSDWENAIATYEIIEPQGTPEGLENATHIWWGSGSQFVRLKTHARKARHHACGAGKTADTLKKHNINPDIFPSVALWRKATNIH